MITLPIDDVTLTVGGRSETVNLASHFRDTVEEDLTYAASSGDPTVVSAVVADGVLTVTSLAAGSAAVTVTASDPSGLTSDPEVFTVIAQSPVNVRIPDAGLRTAIEGELGKQAGETITSAEMEFISSLEGVGRNIQNLTGLKFEVVPVLWTVSRPG